MSLDVYGDGLTTAKFTDTPSPADGARRHAFAWVVGRQGLGQFSTLTLVLPPGGATSGDKGAGAKDVATTTFKAVDTFTVSARRYGDSKSIAVTIAGAAGVLNPAGQVFEVPIEGDTTKVTASVVRNDGRNIALDLNGDGKADTTLVHTVKETSTSPDGKNSLREHHFRRFDKDGVLIGDYEGGMLYVFGGPRQTIPKEQDETTNAPDVNKEAPANRPPKQGDTLGELPETIHAPGGVFELRIDGDGDRTKELVLRLKGIPGTGTTPQSKAQVRVDLVQLSTSAVKTSTFDTTGDAVHALEPRISQVANGHDPTIVDVTSSLKSDYGTNPLPLKLFPPRVDDATKARTYVVEFAGHQVSYGFAAETQPTNPLVKSSTAEHNVGNIARFEVTLGEFGDRFWVMYEPQPGGTGVFSLVAVNKDGPAAARGTPLVGGSAAVTSFVRTKLNPLSFGVDTNGDSKPDIEIFDALSAPTLLSSANAPLAAEHDHVITVAGPAIGADKNWTFYVRNGRFVDGMDTDFGPGTNDKQAAASAAAVQTLGDQADDSRTKDETGKVTKEGDINALLSRLAGALTQSRQKAKDAGLISERLFEAWHGLSVQLIQLGPQVKAHAVDPSKKVDAKLREAAAVNADVLYTELTNATPEDQIETRTVAGRGVHHTTKTNKITGTVITTGTGVFTNDGPGRRLADEIRGDKWEAASRDFERLVLGIDKLIAVKMKPDSDEAKQQSYLVGMTEQMKEIKDKPGITRVNAVFQPDDSYNTNTRKWSEIPLMLFTWKEDGKWWLKDISNPARDPFLDRVSADEDSRTPPRAIFEQLDYARHFPKGIIHYQIPGGDGGQVITTERKHWWEFAQWVGLGLAVVGISLATFGTGSVAATAAAVAFAGSGVASAVYAGGDLYERAKHGDLEPTAVVMDLAQIVAGAFSAGAAISGRIVAAAAQADLAAARGVSGAVPWSGAAARIASVAQRAYLPALGVAATADGVNLLALAPDIKSQIEKVAAGEGSEPDKRAAIVALLAQGLAMGGITILSIKGAMPEIASGRPMIVIDTINGIPVARANHLEAGGVKLAPKGGADAQATARWQSHALDEAAAEGMPAAKALTDDAEFMKGYRVWMEQAEPKVVFKDGKPVANFGPDFQGSADVRTKIQKFVDTKGIGISLYEKAWANAGELRKVEEAVAKSGGTLDTLPGSQGWKEHRSKVVKALGGDAAAEELVARYERFRAGAAAPDVHAYLAERAQLRTVIPDTEVDRLRGLFAEYEVYVTGSATQTGKVISNDIPDIDCVVVVPKGTAPELMAAIEQRGRGMRIRPDPAFLQANGLPPNHTLGLDVKVMTPEQFFGFSTVAPRARTPLNFTRIDTVPGQLEAAELRGMSGKDWVERLKSQLSPDAQSRLATELRTRTPQQVMDSFHGDIDIATTHLSTPGGERPPPLQDTVDMFAVGTIPKSGPDRWAYIEEPGHWKPERQALHVKLLAKAKQQAQAFAEVLKGGQPTLYAMRGNTAAGKTRAVSNNVPELAGAMSATKDLPHRSVNPDNFKADLIAETPGMTSTQVHSESSMLATRHEKQLAELTTSNGAKGDILIDKRLATVGDVQAYAKMAKDTGRKFVLYDVDAPLETSLAGVLERVPGGADPLPPFDVVAQGFTAVRSNRKGVIDMFTADPAFGDYVLYGTTSSGQRVEIATVTGGTLAIKTPDLYALAISGEAGARNAFAKARITSAAIDAMLKDLPADRAAKVGPILRKYEGWTWKAALDAHSVEKPKVD